MAKAGEGGHGYQADPPSPLNRSYCVHQVLLPSFTRLTSCCVSGVDEDMWVQEENLQGKVIAKQVSFLRKSSRSLFQFPLPPTFHLSSCHTPQELWQRACTQLLSFLRGGASGLVAAASSFPELLPGVSATQPSPWEPIPCHLYVTSDPVGLLRHKQT